jgi:hypothetical protein
VCEVEPSFEKKIAESSIFAFAVVHSVAVAEKRIMAMAMAMTAEAMMTEVEGRDEEEMKDDVSASTIDVSASTIDANSMMEYWCSCSEEQ